MWMLEMIEQELGTQSWMDSWSEETNSPSEDVSFYLAWLNRARRADVSLSFSFWSPPSLAGVLLHYIWFFLDYPGSTLVSHPCLYLSARPISHSFWRSVSCGDPDSTVQGSCPRKWGQDVSCVYFMRRWQLILELLFHYSPMAVSLHLCFPLGRSRRLPLGACRFLLLWSRFVENRIVSTTSPGSSNLLRSSSNISSSLAWALGLLWNGPGLPDSWPHKTQKSLFFQLFMLLYYI